METLSPSVQVSTRFIFFYITLPIPTLTVEPDSTVFTGESVTLKCKIDTLDGWTYQWEKQNNQHRWSAVSQSVSHTVNGDTLTISAGAVATVDQYRCRGQLPNRPASVSYSDTVTLTVAALPRPTLTVEPDSTVFTRESVTLKCKIDTLDGWTYQWEKRNNQHRWSAVSQSVSHTVNGDTLTISAGAVATVDQYRCRGQLPNRPASVSYSDTVTLTVAALPIPTLTVEPDSTVFTRESVTLKCKIDTLDGWTYQWEKRNNQRRWSAVSQPVSHTVNGDTLTISAGAVTTVDYYRCRGQLPNRPASVSYSDTVTLTVAALPRPTLTVKPDRTVFTRESVTLKCKIDTLDGWTYQWEKRNNQRRWSAVSQPVSHTVNGDTLTISAGAVATVDQYRCRGQLPNRPASVSYSDTVTLTVAALPRPTLTVKPDRTVFTRESVTLKCKIDTLDGWTYQWEKRNNQRRWSAVSQPVSHTVNGDTLTISAGAVATVDYYRCRGQLPNRPASVSYSDTVTLTVAALPRPTLTVKPDRTVFTGESVTLKCEIDTYDGWTYQWYKWNNEHGQTYWWNNQNKQRQWTTVSQSVYHNGDTLTISVGAVATGDQYRCRGRLPNRPASVSYSDTVTLTVAGVGSGGRGPAQFADFPALTVLLHLAIKRNSAGSCEEFGLLTVDIFFFLTDNLKATVSIKPDKQVFRGENVTLTCNLHGGGDTEWTYSWNKSSLTVHTSTTSQEYKLSVEESDSGKYTCRGERRSDSQRSEISEAVTLTVSAEAQTVLSVSPQSWLTEGDSVNISCEVNGSSPGWTFSWYRGNEKLLSEISRGSGGFYTLSPAALHHTGVYMCRAERGDPAYHTQCSNPQPLWITATSPPASLIISPSRSQHFTADSLSLSCEGQSNSAGWRVRRYTHSERVSNCSSGWGSVIGPICNISSLSSSHTGVYWCESESKGSRNPVNITVHSGAVILDSPVHPVTEGDSLTLLCLYHRTKSSNLTADFYKDGLLLQNQTTGEMTIRTVSKSDEGLYHCKLPEKGESPQSWISVRSSSSNNVPIILALGLSLTLFLIMLCVCCYYKKKKGNQKNTKTSLHWSQNPGSIPLQAGNDHIYDNVGAMDDRNTGTDASGANASDVTYAQVINPKKKQKQNDNAATTARDVTYSQMKMKTFQPCSEDDAMPGPSNAVYSQIQNKTKKPKDKDAEAESSVLTYAEIDLKDKKKTKKKLSSLHKDAKAEPSDVTYSVINLKDKTKPKKTQDSLHKDAKAEPSDVTYSEINLKDKTKPKKTQDSLHKDAEAEPSDVTYSAINMKDKTKPKNKQGNLHKGNSSVAPDTVYSELKQHLQRR
ncbi:basement membrane-specific heparan sulfate proteoglycan core protein-like [Salminus brasiliensis]|uniref:basement membrane-specific heparan sulfate proteoglycan core protein-like n=1 Tax=Salminus brasiliensis TaxID=930266 RepID=UPI003B8346F4